MHGFVRQLFDYDGSNLYPKTHPGAFVSSNPEADSQVIGIKAIGELIPTATAGYEPEFVYRVAENQTSSDTNQLYAVKLRDVSTLLGLDYARLSEPLTVTNPIGIAGTSESEYPNGYPAGTSLELVIREMLTAGTSIYDVLKVLTEASVSVILVNGIPVSNGGSVSISEGTNINISFDASFADGWFYGANGYDNETFDSNHNGQAPYFDASNHRLYAGSPLNTVQLLENNVVVIDASQGIRDEMMDINGDHSGSHTFTYTTVMGNTNKVYEIKLIFGANTTQPYKSDGTVSHQTINGSTISYTFNLIRAQVTEYDVVAHNPVVSSSTFNIGTDYTIRSQYDASNNTNTGVWVGDTAFATFNKDFTFYDGYFTPETGWSVSDFETINAQQGNIVNGKLLAACTVPNGSVTAKLNTNSSVNTTYQKTESSDHVSAQFSINEQNVLLNGAIVSSNTLKLDLPYSGNTTRALTSQGNNSNIDINAGKITFTSAFNASTDFDVIIGNNPKVRIEYVVIDGSIYNDGDILRNHSESSESDINGTIVFRYDDGNFTPSNGYNDNDFIDNNPGSYEELGIYYHDASCTIITVKKSINSVESIATPVDSSISFTDAAFADGKLEFKLKAEHSASQYIPKKLSTRNSSVRFDSSIIISDALTLYPDNPQQNYHFVMVTTSDTSTGDTIYANVEQLLTGTTVHFNDTSTAIPAIYTKTGSIFSNVGNYRNVFIVAAPVEYKVAKVYYSNVDQGLTPVLVPVASSNNGIPYSANSTDNIKYRLFKFKNTLPVGYTLDKVELSYS